MEDYVDETFLMAARFVQTSGGLHEPALGRSGPVASVRSGVFSVRLAGSGPGLVGPSGASFYFFTDLPKECHPTQGAAFLQGVLYPCHDVSVHIFRWPEQKSPLCERRRL